MKNTQPQPQMDLFSPATRHNVRACFECGRVGNIHDHHVVPRILGGTKTVPLCEECHGKVHGRDMSGHRALTLRGLDDARRRGKVLGRPTGSTVTKDELIAKHPDIVRNLRAKKSIRDVAKITGKAKGTVLAVKKAMA